MSGKEKKEETEMKAKEKEAAETATTKERYAL